MSNTTSEMRWWRTNSFGGGEKDGEWNGSLFLGRKGLEGMVVCGREERRGERREEKEEEKEIYFLSILILQTPSAPLRGLHPAGLTPCGDTLSYTLHSIPYPTNTDPKMGDPHLLPTRGKGGKRGGKGHFLTIHTPNFLSGGEPPDPPTRLGRARKRQEKRGRALT